MATQHNVIADADRHEAKGASTATNGQVLKANGGGTTSFVNPSTLTNVVVTSILEAGDTTSQSPSALDTPMTVLFGPTVSTTDVSLSAGGVLTFNTAAYYKVELNLNAQRPTGAGQVKLLARVLVNGAAIEPTRYVILPDNLVASVPLRFEIERAFNATNTLSVQLIRDSTGINSGSLLPLDPVLSGWATAPSAFVSVKKLVGVV